MKPLQKSAAIAICAAISLSPAMSQAGIKEAMNELFVSTSTESQAFETQRLMGVYGGSMTFRPVGRGINIMQFAPPRIDAGCGGIDIFFGSFSFVNGEQFEQLIRSLAANAAGYAIKAGIRLMCDPCGGILKELEDAVRELNALAKNTCAIASAPFRENGIENLAEKARNVGNRFSKAGSVISDWAAGENRSTAQSATETAKSAMPDDNPAVGNIVWRAAKQTMTSGTNTLSAFLSEAEVIQIVQSLFGTTIILPDATPNAPSPSGASSVCGNGVPTERCERPGFIVGPTLAKWDMLFDPKKYSNTGTPVWSCANTDCTHLNAGTMSFSTWGGTREIVNLAIYGVADPSGGPATYTSDSIAGSIIHGSTSLSARARALLNFSPNLYRYLLEVQKTPGAVNTIAAIAAEILPDQLSYQIATELLAIGKNAFSIQNKVMPPENYENEVRSKSVELDALRPQAEKTIRAQADMMDIIKGLQSLMGSPWKPN